MIIATPRIFPRVQELYRALSRFMHGERRRIGFLVPTGLLHDPGGLLEAKPRPDALSSHDRQCS